MAADDCVYYQFYSKVACLMVEGVEFMGKLEIYEEIKKEFQDIQTKNREFTIKNLDREYNTQDKKICDKWFS